MFVLYSLSPTENQTSSVETGRAQEGFSARAGKYVRPEDLLYVERPRGVI